MTILETIDRCERAYIERIEELEAEVTYWKDRWFNDTMNQIKRNDAMCGQILMAALDGALQRSESAPSADAVDPVDGIVEG